MIKDYKTIRQIANPLMIVEQVEGVTYDELCEIELPDGEVRRGKVLEVEGDRAVVQLFDSAQGINLARTKVRFLGHPRRALTPRSLSRPAFPPSTVLTPSSAVRSCPYSPPPAFRTRHWRRR